MTEFIKWAFDIDTPFWVSAICLVALVMGFVFVLITSIWLLNIGLWMIPVAIWVFIPAYLVVREYLKAKGEAQ